MEQYITTLKKTLETKGFNYFWSICDGTFKIMREPMIKIQQKIKKDHRMYSGKNFAEVNLLFNTIVNKTDWVFAISVILHHVSDKEPKFIDSWKLVLKYTLKDLELHPFNISDVENLMRICCTKLVVTSDEGILYTDFISKLKDVKMKRINRRK